MLTVVPCPFRQTQRPKTGIEPESMTVLMHELDLFVHRQRPPNMCIGRSLSFPRFDPIWNPPAGIQSATPPSVSLRIASGVFSSTRMPRAWRRSECSRHTRCKSTGTREALERAKTRWRSEPPTVAGVLLRVRDGRSDSDIPGIIENSGPSEPSSASTASVFLCSVSVGSFRPEMFSNSIRTRTVEISTIHLPNRKRQPIGYVSGELVSSSILIYQVLCWCDCCRRAQFIPLFYRGIFNRSMQHSPH